VAPGPRNSGLLRETVVPGDSGNEKPLTPTVIEISCSAVPQTTESPHSLTHAIILDRRRNEGGWLQIHCRQCARAWYHEWDYVLVGQSAPVG